MGIYTIYKATNLINGKSYIGFDSNWPNRQKAHLYNAKMKRYKGIHFHNALRKYGFENFSWSIIFQSNDLFYTKNIMEPFFISAFDTFLGEGYNMTAGGDGITGLKHTDDTRTKLKRPLTDDHKKKISKALTGKKQSPETIQKRIPYLKGRIVSGDTKQKQSISLSGSNNPMYGKPPWNKGLKLGPKGPDSEYTKIKKSISAKNRPQIECPHCKKIGSSPQMKRYHFNKCKNKS